MPVIPVNLPVSLWRDIKLISKKNETDTDTFIKWALAEKIGEHKERIINKALQREVYTLETLLSTYPAIIKVTPLEKSIIHLEFDNGLEGDYDMKPLIQHGGEYEALKSEDIFKSPKIADYGGFIDWDGGISISAGVIYEQMWPPKNEMS